MKYTLDSFPDINPKAFEILKECGIDNSDIVLQQLSLPSQRKEFSELFQEKLKEHSYKETTKEIGLDEEGLISLAGMADLVRIKGISLKTARLFVKSQLIRNVQEFIQQLIPRMDVKKPELTGWTVLMGQGKQFIQKFYLFFGIKQKIQPGVPTMSAARASWQERLADGNAILEEARKLQQRLAASNPVLISPSSIPGPKRLAEMVEEAVELRPRLVLSSQENGMGDFRRKMNADYRKELAPSLINNLKLSLILFILVILGYFTIVIVCLINFRPNPSDYPGDYFSYALIRASQNEIILSGLLFCIIAMVLYLITLLLFTVISGRSEFYMNLFLMRSAADRSFYGKASLIGFSKNLKKAITVSYFIFAIGGLLFMADAIIQLFSSSDFFLERYSISAIIFGLLLGLVVCLPKMVHVMNQVPVNWKIEQESFKRYFFSLLLSIVKSSALGFIALYIILNSFSSIYHFFYKNIIIPAYVSKVEKICIQEFVLDASEDMDYPDPEEMREDCKNLARMFGSEPNWKNLSVLDPGMNLWIETRTILVWVLNNFAIWALISLIICYFIFPFLWLGSWRRGVFYLSLLAIAAMVARVAQENSVKWLNLEPGSLGTGFLIGFILLTIAILFDWAYDAIAEPKKPCPACQNLIADNEFCPICGFAQVTITSRKEGKL